MKQFGKYYNNGTINIRIKEGDPIPEGFIPGMKPRTEEQRLKALEKRKKTNLERFGVEMPLQSSSVKERMKEKSIAKWGVDHPMKSDTMKDKYKQIFLEHYGVENPSQSEEIQKKKIETSLAHWGTEHPAQSEEIKEKAKQTSLERYGVDNPSKSELVKEKIVQTNLSRYGTEYTWQSEEVKEKIKQTNLKRYGVENPQQSSEIREKTHQAVLEKYGVDNQFQSEEIKEKSKQTSLEIYGTEYPNQSEEVKEKIIQSSLEHWGVENPMQSEEVKNIYKKSLIEKYGVSSLWGVWYIRDKIKRANLERYGTEYPSQSPEIKKKVSETCQQRFGVPWACMRPEARFGYSNDSVPNKIFAGILDSVGIEYEREFNLERYSYDFKIGNILIEIDPIATHNTLWSPFNPNHGISQDYHLNKSLTAEKHNFHCIHIFDWDNVDVVIKSLVGEQEFNFSKFGRCVELKLRSVRDCDEYIQSEFDKLVRDNDFDLVISHCDFSKYRRDIYIKLGFKLIKSEPPRCHWCNPKTHDHIVSGEDISQFGYVSVYDCGIYTYIWNR